MTLTNYECDCDCNYDYDYNYYCGDTAATDQTGGLNGFNHKGLR